MLSLEAILKFVPMSSTDGASEHPLILEHDAEHSFMLFRIEVPQPAHYSRICSSFRMSKVANIS